MCGESWLKSWILKRAIIHHLGCDYRWLFLRVNKGTGEENIPMEPFTSLCLGQGLIIICVQWRKLFFVAWRGGVTACLKAGFWGGAQACSSLVHQESSGGYLSDAEQDRHTSSLPVTESQLHQVLTLEWLMIVTSLKEKGYYLLLIRGMVALA